MTARDVGEPASTSPVAACQRCGRSLRGRLAFRIGGGDRCLRCTLRHPPLLRRSLLTALVVGTVLTAINQGTTIASGDLPVSLAWKVPLTYSVPFLVATWGALINSRIAT
jgi:hypothetical protein